MKKNVIFYRDCEPRGYFSKPHRYRISLRPVGPRARRGTVMVSFTGRAASRLSYEKSGAWYEVSTEPNGGTCLDLVNIFDSPGAPVCTHAWRRLFPGWPDLPTTVYVKRISPIEHLPKRRSA